MQVISTLQGIFNCLYSACIVFTSNCGTVVQSCVVRSGLMLLLHDLARQEWVFLPFPKFCIFSRPYRLHLFMCGVTEEPTDISTNYVKICTLRVARLQVNKENDVIVRSSVNSLPNFKYLFFNFIRH